MGWVFDTPKGRPAGQKLRVVDGVKLCSDGTAVDSRRSKTYKWENIVVNIYNTAQTKHLTKPQITKLVRDICTEHGSIVPKIYFYGSKSSNYTHFFNEPHISTMRFAPGWGMKLCVVLHEIAHCLQWNVYSPRTEPAHSPIFLRIYIDLLVKYAGMDRIHLQTTAKLARIPPAANIEYRAPSMQSFHQSVVAASEQPIKRGRGRPPGSKNRPKV